MRHSASMRPGQNGRHFADDTFKRIFLNENVGISIKISHKFVHKGPNNNIPALVQMMAWRRPGDKPLSEPMVVRLPTHICVTRPQWVNCVAVNHWLLLFRKRSQTNIWFMTWICNYIHVTPQDVIIHPWPLVKPPLNLGHGWVIPPQKTSVDTFTNMA